MLEPDELARLIKKPVRLLDTAFAADDWADRSEIWGIDSAAWLVLQQDRAQVRMAELEGYLARAAVLARGPVLVILNLNQVTQAKAQRIHAFVEQAQRMGPLAVILTSRSGGGLVWFPDEPQFITPPHKSRANTNQPASPNNQALHFTPAVEWILKILLLRDVDTAYWNGPRQPVRSVRELAKAADVGYATAHRTWSSLRARHWATEDAHGTLLISAVADLVTEWMNSARNKPQQAVPVRPLYNLNIRSNTKEQQRLALKELSKRYENTRHEWAFSGWAACRIMKVLHVTGSKPITMSVASSDLTSLLAEWKLQACDPRDASFMIHLLPAGSKNLQGTIKTQTLPHVDIWQAAIDVCSDPARGYEQGEHIARTLLQQSLL